MALEDAQRAWRVAIPSPRGKKQRKGREEKGERERLGCLVAATACLCFDMGALPF
jgi:hypothetical protein